MSLLSGKTALVTGGGKGIGRAIVDSMNNQGAQVITCGRGARPDDLADEIHWQRCDVSKLEDIARLKNTLIEQYENLHIVVNNAGMQIEKNIVDTTDEDWDNLMGVNAKGVFMICRALIPIMNEMSSIINIGSISGNVADTNMAIYNASKAFVHGLTRSIAVDHGPAIRCNAISPGWVMTEMADAAFEIAHSPSKAKEDALGRHCVGRFAKPEDIANLAIWLASDQSSFASGQCYVLDGGLTAASPIKAENF